MVNKITKIVGKAITLKGDNVDTDRIIPARFLKALTFTELGDSAFIDDRTQSKISGKLHSFDDPKFKGSSVLVVNDNFGCGSSREAAPQSLHRYGIKAIIGSSFGDIFLSNSVAIGMPCLAVTTEDTEKIQALSNDGGMKVAINIEKQTVEVNNEIFHCSLNKGVKSQFLDGSWDALNELILQSDVVEGLYKKIPYTSW